MNPYQQYQNNSVLTASKNELTLMLYNGAIKFGNQAIDAINKKDLQACHIAIVKMQNIIEELRVTLNKNFPIAQEMDRLYEFVSYLLVEANMYKDTEKIEDALHIVREFRDTWHQAMKVK